MKAKSVGERADEFVAMVRDNPGLTAKRAGELGKVVATLASYYLLELERAGRVARLKLCASFRYYETIELANQSAAAVYAEDEKMRRTRPLSSISGFTVVGPKLGPRQKAGPSFADAKPDYSKAKRTIAPPPRGRYDVEPGFKGEFTREWEERRRA